MTILMCHIIDALRSSVEEYKKKLSAVYTSGKIARVNTIILII